MKRIVNYCKMNKWRLSVGIIIIVLICCIISFLKLGDKETAALIAVTITVYIGLIKQNLDDDKLFQELFLQFNSRYDNEMNDLFNKLRTEQNEKELKDDDKLLIIDYFNLCSEEYLWYTRRRLLPEVWEAWECGIIVNLRIKQVKEIFYSEANNINTRKSYYGFIEYFEKRI